MAEPRALLPAADVPLLYFGFAHVCLAGAFAILISDPSLPGQFFLHPRMVAVVHLVTLGWISGSILGAFYIVGPLALRMPLRSGWSDRVAFAAFAVGVAGMAAQFWRGSYASMSSFAILVVAALLHVGARAALGLRGSVAPSGVKLHVALAFVNVLGASLFGAILGLNRTHGWFSWSPFAAAYAHLHLAAVGWATMMFVGLAYRLIPMIVPAAMPKAGTIALSAWLIESGLVVLIAALLRGSSWTVAGAALIVGGLASFVVHVRQIVAHRLPPPAALPRPDWATWQTHVALLWLLVAAACGVVLSLPGSRTRVLEWGWLYGTAGLIGFLAQVITGIQGRLLPMHAWYGAFESGGFKPPSRSAHVLGSPALARAIFIAWTVGVPLLAAGLARAASVLIAAASIILFAGVVLNAVQAVRIAIVARSPQPSG